MGQPKALLPFAGEPLIAHIVRTLQQHFDELLVVAAPGQELPPLPVKMVHDDVAYQGPVGGIYYGLKAAEGEVCFITSCDSAFLNAALIGHLVSSIGGYDVVVPRWQGRYQPLHAAYRRSVLPFLERQLAAGELRPVFLFDRVSTRQVDEEEIRQYDPEGLSFFNMNAPDDYEEALARWSARPSLDRGAPERTSIDCIVELFGVARMTAGTREVPLTVHRGATYADVFRVLAEKHPELVGRVIAPDRRSLLDGHACNANGLDFVRSAREVVGAGDRILIVSADAGG
jgi:molybdopterin-guanine dinucleotide biosynthesis protein A